MQTLGGRLDGQASGVLDAVERQSRMIVDASDLAQTQLREAEAALAARASDLAAAAGEAQDAARLAADDLARQTLRLENAGSGVAEQIQSVEEGLGQQRAALVTAAYALRTDQEDFSAQVESQRAQLTEQLSAARSASPANSARPRPSASEGHHAIWSRPPPTSSAPSSTCPSARPTASTPPPNCRSTASRPWPPRRATP